MVESMLDIEKTKQLLKRHDLRSSKPRLAILGVFHERPRHITAENLFYELKHRGENLSLSTVYLNLGVLKEAGLVRELQGANGESVYDSNVSPHDHLICRGCDTVVDIPETTLLDTKAALSLQAEVSQAAPSWRVDKPAMNFYGLCPKCQ